jgi:hypothetical protein
VGNHDLWMHGYFFEDELEFVPVYHKPKGLFITTKRSLLVMVMVLGPYDKGSTHERSVYNPVSNGCFAGCIDLDCENSTVYECEKQLISR